MMLGKQLLVLSSLLLGLSGCASFDTRSARAPDPAAPPQQGGGYYKDDGPGLNPPADLAGIPDAQPRAEPLHRFANRPYKALGRTYTPLPAGQNYKASGGASWYGRRYHGNPTSSGEPYDMYAMTAAHPILPIPSYVRVTNPANGRSVVVRVNDRGPFFEGRIIDLSYTAAWKLDLLRGVAPVEVELLDPAAELAAPTPAPVATPVAVTAAPVESVTVAALPAAPAIPAAAAPPAALVSGHYLQIGAFRRPEAAIDLSRRVQDSLGPSTSVVQVESDGLIKVQVGPYSDLNLASLAAEALQQRLGIRAYRISR